jgi:dihydrofolate reductase
VVVSMIAVMSQDEVMGVQGPGPGPGPWNIPAVLAHCKALTLGHTVLMGRNTYESIGSFLPGCSSIVLTRSGAEHARYRVARSLLEALSLAEDDEEIFICGGAPLLHQALPFCQRIYLTIIQSGFPGKERFPEMPSAFQQCHRKELPEAFPPLSFLVFEKVEQIEPGADVQELCLKGREAIHRRLFFLARHCFETALSFGACAEIASELSFCLASIGAAGPDALRMAEDALQSDPGNLRCRLNLGRVQILAGNRESGLTTLRAGVQLGGGEEFLAELARCSAGHAPAIRSLPRNHPLNRHLGLLLRRMREGLTFL